MSSIAGFNAGGSRWQGAVRSSNRAAPSARSSSFGARIEGSSSAIDREIVFSRCRWTDQALTAARSLGADPLAVDAAAQRAFADYQLGRTIDALGYLTLRCNRTLSLLNQGRLAEGAKEAETALALDNDMFRTLAARDCGDPVAAARYGEQALAAAWGLSVMATAFAGLYLAEALLDLSAPERALSVLLTAAGGPDLAPIAPPLRPRGYELLARAELARGQVGVPRAGGAHTDPSRGRLGHDRRLPGP